MHFIKCLLLLAIGAAPLASAFAPILARAAAPRGAVAAFAGK